VTVAKKGDMALSEHGTTSVAVKYGDTQLAVYHVPKRGFYATQQMYVGLSFGVSLFLIFSWIGVHIVERSFLITELLEIRQAENW